MKRCSCSAVPFGNALWLVRGTLFPLRVRLTFGAPGLPGKHAAECFCFRLTRVGVVLLAACRPDGPALRRCSCDWAITATGVRIGGAACLVSAVPYGDTLTVVQGKGFCGLRSLLLRYACYDAGQLLLAAWLATLTSTFHKESGIRLLWCMATAAYFSSFASSASLTVRCSPVSIDLRAISPRSSSSSPRMAV